MAVACKSIMQSGWLELREQLWPHHTRAAHVADMSLFLLSPERHAQYVEYDPAGLPLGFVEVSLRTDYVNGAESSPVAFLEGLFVVVKARRQGVARALIEKSEQWALSRGCSEFASDALLENIGSHAMHAALGFRESERVVFFKKDLHHNSESGCP